MGLFWVRKSRDCPDFSPKNFKISTDFSGFRHWYFSEIFIQHFWKHPKRFFPMGLVFFRGIGNPTKKPPLGQKTFYEKFIELLDIWENWRAWLLWVYMSGVISGGVIGGWGAVAYRSLWGWIGAFGSCEFRRGDRGTGTGSAPRTYGNQSKSTGPPSRVPVSAGEQFSENKN